MQKIPPDFRGGRKAKMWARLIGHRLSHHLRAMSIK